MSAPERPGTDPHAVLRHHVSDAVERGTAQPVAEIRPGTRAHFLHAYRARLVERYEWAATDPAKLSRFLSSAADTISGAANSWNWDGDAVRDAWRDVGGKGRPTLKALRALPVQP